MPASVAAQTPRSVIRLVISRAGVTSNAKFAAALPGAAIITSADAAAGKGAAHVGDLAR